MTRQSRTSRKHISRRTDRSSKSSKKHIRRRYRRRKSVSREKSMSRVNTEMSLTELQKRAKTLGIPFGGLTKSKLVNKINRYI